MSNRNGRTRMEPQISPETPPMPRSIRTNLMMGGGAWTLDEEPEDVAAAIAAFLLGTESYLTFHADRRPMIFSRKLVELWSACWEFKHPEAGEVQVVDDPSVVRQFNPPRR